MVHGLEKFKEYFRDYANQYVIIGGTACDILMNELGASFRATKDLDIVLIIEKLDLSFGEAFWKFIEDGGYEHREKNEGMNQFYRFKNPKDSSFPKMIELFSKQQSNINLKFNTGLTPIHIDDSITSLSAILLNDDYYDLLLREKRDLDGCSLIEIETVILFKIKAWLDFKSREESGKHVDLRNLKKHKNDVFRLLVNVSPTRRIETSKEIKSDVIHFVELIKLERPNLKQLGLGKTSLDELLETIDHVFLK